MNKQIRIILILYALGLLTLAFNNIILLIIGAILVSIGIIISHRMLNA